MSRILILAVAGVLLLGAPLAADQMLQNDDNTPADGNDAADQQTFTEAVTPFYDFTPILLAVIAIGAILAGVRVVGR